MEVQDELISYLSELQTPDGTPAFEYVKPREAVYDGGKHIQDAPDVVCMPFTRGNTISPDVFGPSFRPNDSYEHRPNGVFIGSSPMLQTENDIQISHTDIAPTVMSLLDVPVPERMCGQPPDELGLETTSEVYEDVPYVSAGGENDSQVTNRLRDLGYL
jgi:predicted AlkP superfamily phosphohydrolase/phosphomutase